MSDRDLFTDEHAEILKKRHRTAYRPSNGTEGEMFMERFCYQCTKDTEGNPCQIMARSMAFNTSDLDYPGEWQYGPNGQPTCTEFEEDSPR